MEKTIPYLQGMAGYRVNEYLLVIQPHDELSERITAVRDAFAIKYQAPSAKWGRPQLVLASFSQFEMMEERILATLRKQALAFPPFKIEIRNFGSFPSHTIYLDVTTKVPVQALVRGIRSAAQRLMKYNEENKPLFILEPHITIARKLKPWQYEKGWLEYSNRHFSGKFIATGMSLLKKNAKDTRFRLVERMEFQNMPVTTKQGELF